MFLEGPSILFLPIPPSVFPGHQNFSKPAPPCTPLEVSVIVSTWSSCAVPCIFCLFPSCLCWFIVCVHCALWCVPVSAVYPCSSPGLILVFITISHLVLPLPLQSTRPLSLWTGLSSHPTCHPGQTGAILDTEPLMLPLISQTIPQFHSLYICIP